jgi:hypothetical protein
MCRLARALATIAFSLAAAGMLADGDDHVSFVPWRVIEPGTEIDAPLVLFWIPATTDELRHSDLLTSDALLQFSTRCVAMRVVRLSDSVRVAGLAGDDSRLPLAVLTDRDGVVIGRVTSGGDALPAGPVEDLVREELDRREEHADDALDRARACADARDTQGAAALYQSVWKDRCVCPRQGRDAGRALRKMARK